MTTSDDFQLTPARESATDETRSDKHRFVSVMREAMELHQSGRLKEAAEAYQRALEAHPDQPEALNYAGFLAHQMGDNERAIALLERSVGLAGDNPSLITNLAKVQQAIGDPAAAAASYQRALALSPEDAVLHFNLGTVLEQQGKPAKASECYRRAIELNPEESRAFTNIGKLLQQQGKLNKAADFYRRALNIDPKDSFARNNLGATLRRLGKTDKAALAFRRTLAMDPQNLRANIELGSLLAENGDFDEAATCFRRALEIEPESGAAYRHLSAIKSFAADDPDLAAMERLIADPATPEVKALDLQFALGTAYEDLGDYDRAFASFANGNRLKRQSIEFDIARMEAESERDIAAFDAEVLSRNRDAGSSSDLPIFILGIPCSGAKIVEQILARHPEVYAAGDTPLLRQFAATLPHRAGSDRPFPDCVEALTADDWTRLGEFYVTALGKLEPGARRITDTTAGNFNLVGLIHLMLPQARIIYCTRDPLDTCWSCFKQLFAEGHEFCYDLAELGRVHRLYERCMAHWHAALPERIFALPHADLVADLEGTARRLLAHCGLDWDPACLELPPRQASALRESGAKAWAPYEAHLGPLTAALTASS